MNDCILVAIYGHPEGYPPTLNCVQQLSQIYKKVILVGRNVLPASWDYPSNCTVIYSGDYLYVRDVEQVSLVKKLRFFFLFLMTLRSAVRKYKVQTILLYDPIALYSYFLVSKLLIDKPKVKWYHNHDVLDIANVKKYSVQWWAGKNERKMFRHLNVFSLPADERKRHFPLNELNGTYFLLPNFPSKFFFGKHYTLKKIEREVKLIFQGSVAKGHGLEEIASLLDINIRGRDIYLIIKGWMSDASYIQRIKEVTISKGKEQNLHVVGFGPYKELPVLTSTCHIGIGIHALNSDLHTSLGKSSNKLYEYASVGLPIIVFDSPHYRFHLQKYKWVFFTDLTRESLIKCISDIIEDYEILSKQAHEDFLNELNFERSFEPVANYLLNQKII